MRPFVAACWRLAPEMSGEFRHDYVVVNDDFERACELRAVVVAGRRAAAGGWILSRLKLGVGA